MTRWLCGSGSRTGERRPSPPSTGGGGRPAATFAAGVTGYGCGMPVISRVLERVLTAVEGARVLDGLASTIDTAASWVPPGSLKDVLSGTPIGHALHPSLVTVPIGSFTSALVLDLTEDAPQAARRLVGFGLLSSVPAALAGLSDWSDTRGAERRIGVVHLGVNALGLSLLTGSWAARRRGGGTSLALAGLGLVGASGWLGGHLSYAMGVGVDTTAFLRPPIDWTDACALEDLANAGPHVVTVESMPILLVRRGDRILAIGDRCTHRGGPLHEGTLDDDRVECPWHGSRFDLHDGAVRRGPATRPAARFETRVVDGRVQVRRTEERTLRLNPAT